MSDIEETLPENLPPSVLLEDNEEVRKVVRRLEELKWHPFIQDEAYLYAIKGQDRDFAERSFHYCHVVSRILTKLGYNFSLRKRLIIFLGVKCQFCGTDNIDYLELDHKSNDGGIERTRFTKHKLNLMLFYWSNLIEAFMSLQVLCIKCHRLKSAGRIDQIDIIKSQILSGQNRFFFNDFPVDMMTRMMNLLTSLGIMTLKHLYCEIQK